MKPKAQPSTPALTWAQRMLALIHGLLWVSQGSGGRPSAHQHIVGLSKRTSRFASKNTDGGVMEMMRMRIQAMTMHGSLISLAMGCSLSSMLFACHYFKCLLYRYIAIFFRMRYMFCFVCSCFSFVW